MKTFTYTLAKSPKELRSLNALNVSMYKNQICITYIDDSDRIQNAVFGISSLETFTY